MNPTDALFQALANETRRTILDIVKENSGCNVSDVCAHFSMSRIGVMKHLKILTEAGLIVSVKEGRERKLYFNVVPIQTVYDRWTTEYSALWASRLTRLKYAVESGSKFDESPEPPPEGKPSSSHSHFEEES